MLINVSQPEECRIAIIEDGVLEELYIERASQDNYVGNIYKGRIVNLEPTIQAAFVDFGVGRNGFLHISDVEPQYFRQGGYSPDDPALADNGGRLDDIDDGEEGRRRQKPERAAAAAAAADLARAAGPDSSRRFRRSSAAATKCWSRSSRKGSAPRGRRCRPTSAFPAATWC